MNVVFGCCCWFVVFVAAGVAQQQRRVGKLNAFMSATNWTVQISLPSGFVKRTKFVCLFVCTWHTVQWKCCLLLCQKSLVSVAFFKSGYRRLALIYQQQKKSQYSFRFSTDYTYFCSTLLLFGKMIKKITSFVWENTWFSSAPLLLHPTVYIYLWFLLNRKKEKNKRSSVYKSKKEKEIKKSI